MLKKLAADGYLEQIARGEVKLTQKGLEVAVRVLRRHRLAERLLTDVLGMGWEEVHSEACMLEHAISDKVEQRLIALLGDPQTCPHGQPIPPKDLSDPVRSGLPLTQFDVGSHATVRGVTEELPEILKYLGDMGVRPGTAIAITAKAPLGGPITVSIGGKEHPISVELARMITATHATR